MTHTWIRREDVLWRRVGSDVVLRPRERRDPAEPLVVTAPGAVAWELLGQGRSIEDLVECIGGWDPVELPQVQDDLMVLLDTLRAECAVERVGDVPPRGDV